MVSVGREEVAATEHLRAQEKSPQAAMALGRKSLVAVITARLLLREEKQGAGRPPRVYCNATYLHVDRECGCPVTGFPEGRS